MAKGSGGSGGSYGSGGAGGRAADTAAPALQAFLASGLRGVPVPSSGLRPESFAYLRSGGVAYGGKPKIQVETKTGTPRIVDGRHRISLARERGESTIDADVYTLGPRGAARLAYTGPVKI